MRPDTRRLETALRKDLHTAFVAAKHLRDNVDVRAQIDTLSELSLDDPRIQRVLTGVCVPKKWAEVLWRPSTVPIKNLKRSVSWFTAIAERFQEPIRKHVELRDRATRAALKGRWEDVWGIVQIHQHELGPSLWSLAWSMTAADESGGASVRHRLREGFTSSDPVSQIDALAGCFSVIADKTLPEHHSVRAIRHNLSGLSGSFLQILEVILLEDHSKPLKLPELLHEFESLSVIDRYEAFLRVVAFALASLTGTREVLSYGLTRLLRFLDDRHLLYLASCIGVVQMPRDKLGGLVVRAWDAFVTSQYDLCFDLAREGIEEDPSLLVTHELFVKSAMYLGKTDVFTGTTPEALLWQHMHHVFAKTEQSEDSLNYLQRFAARFRIFPLSTSLRALHAQHSSPYADEKWSRRASYTMCVNAPRNFEYGHSSKTNSEYLERCAEEFPDSKAIHFFRSISAGEGDDSLNPAVPEIRQCFFSGLSAARNGDTGRALAKLQHFLDLQTIDATNPLSPFAMEEARRWLVEMYRMRGAVVEMQRAIVDAYLTRPQSIRRLPIVRAFEACEERRDEACSHIDYAILAYLALNEPHAVSMALRRFLRAKQVTIPTALNLGPADDIHRFAVLRLRVCTIEVLDSFQDLDTFEKVEAERLKLLDWVAKNVQPFARMAETEVLRLTQDAQLRGALEKIEEARVVLNLSALREAEQQRFSDAYFRYSAQRQLASDEFLQEVLQAVSNPSGSVRVLRLSKMRGELATFIGAFHDIRDAFLLSPHFGLEACLSGRIRHGFVVQHLRKPFVEHQLAVRVGTPEFQSVKNYWQGRPYLANDSASLESVMVILGELTLRLDEIAEEVKSVWMQTKTEARNADGLFDYSFSETELSKHSGRMSEAGSVEAFIDGAFDILVGRTRTNLERVRSRVRGHLQERLVALIETAMTQLNALPWTANVGSVKTTLTTCRSEIERTCQQLARWFEDSDATLVGAVFDFDLIARTAVGMIEQLNPNSRSKHSIKVDSPYQVKGRHFTAIVHIIFFLLENAIRYSKVSNDRFHSALSIIVEGNQLSIMVENETESSEAAEAATARIAAKVGEFRRSLDPEKVIREGGSGFAKIIAAVRYEFKQRDPVVAATASGCRLQVSVKCEIAGLIP